MPGSYSLIGILLLVLFIIIDGILYCFQSALSFINVSVIEKHAEEGDKKAARILKMIDNPAKFGNTLDITVFITNVFVGSYILRSLVFMVVKKGEENVGIFLIVATLVLTILIVAGVLVPKKIGQKYPEKSLNALCGPAVFLTGLLTPVAFFVTAISNPILRLIGINPKEDLDNVTEEEIITMVNEGQEQGVLEASEAEMITNVFEFGDKEAQDIMVHRSNIVAINCELPLKEAFKLMLAEKYSRYPVYDEDVDNIVGLIYLRDVTAEYESGRSRTKKIKDIPSLIREAYFIPETRKIDALFKEMQTKKIHLALVSDEYGQTIGIVTMEDIIEEIFGNIFDEYDEEEEHIAKTADDSYEVDGFTLLDDLEELLGIEFVTEDFETVNGFMISRLHRLPVDGEMGEFDYKGYNFKIMEASNRVIRKVRITRLPAESINDEDTDSETQ